MKCQLLQPMIKGVNTFNMSDFRSISGGGGGLGG